MKRIVIACTSDWLSEDDFDNLRDKMEITFINQKEDLSFKTLENLRPDYVFFPHWNWKISNEIIDAFKPIIFHTAPLPKGRGGSPIQNLILAGYKSSPVWALFATEKLDEGPLITSLDVSLEGNLSEIFGRIKEVVIQMIIDICEGDITSTPQEGEIEKFKRLTISDNLIMHDLDINSVYDRIRMVDAPGYPNAYIDYGNLKIEFEKAELKGNEIVTTAKITVMNSK